MEVAGLGGSVEVALAAVGGEGGRSSGHGREEGIMAMGGGGYEGSIPGEQTLAVGFGLVQLAGEGRRRPAGERSGGEAGRGRRPDAPLVLFPFKKLINCK